MAASMEAETMLHSSHLTLRRDLQGLGYEWEQRQRESRQNMIEEREH